MIIKNERVRRNEANEGVINMADRKYLVNFYSTNAEVEAENEEEAIEKAKILFYDGELYCEVESVEELKE